MTENQNINLENTTVESTYNKPQESIGGDSSRTATAMKIVLILIPAIIIESLVNTLGWSNEIIEIVFSLYQFAFQIGLTLLLAYAVYETVNFVFDKNEQPNTNSLMMYLLMVLVIVPFSIFGFAESGLGIISLNLGSPKMWYFLLLIVVLAYTATKNIDIRDVLVSIFMVTIFMFYSVALTNIINDWALLGIFLVIGIAIVSDTMAYVGGKQYGKRKAFPDVSPNKTVEGLIAGLLSAIAYGLIIFAIMFVFKTNNVLVGVAVNAKVILAVILGALVSPFGDLTFSKVKRSYNKKDFSNLLPGHGGLFDRLDSHIFVTIVMFAIIN